MLDLIALFDSIELPSATLGENARFSAQPLPGYECHRLGKDIHGNPSLLIAVGGSSKRDYSIPIKLKNLEVQYDVNCRISHLNGSIEEGDFTLLRCTTNDQAVQAYFLRIIGPIVLALGPNPSHKIVANLIERVVELFRAMTEPPRKTIQGLWAELFIMARSREPATITRAWHSTPEDRYDFSDHDQRIEVKSAAGRIRQHHFSLEQLCPPAGTHLLVASLFVERMGVGTSTMELLGQIRSRINDNLDLLFQLDRVIALTLGEDLHDALEERFDSQLAEESLAFFELSHIPMINSHLPLGVSNVHFKSDLTGRPTIDIARYRSQGGLFQAALRRR